MKTARQSNNLRTGLVLLSVALAFFAGVVAKYWLLGAG
jgi:hypothetical protein